jgi:hypothetical protein
MLNVTKKWQLTLHNFFYLKMRENLLIVKQNYFPVAGCLRFSSNKH